MLDALFVCFWLVIAIILVAHGAKKASHAKSAYEQKDEQGKDRRGLLKQSALVIGVAALVFFAFIMAIQL